MQSVMMTRFAILILVALSLAACGSSGKNGKAGAAALINTTLEAAGANCEMGGWKIQSGTDKNNDGSLSPDEVQSVSYICNGKDGTNGVDGQNGQSSLNKMTPIVAGAECIAGGYRMDTGLDTNGNGVLDTYEISHTSFICHGADGEDGLDGINGTSALVDTAVEAPGAYCSVGGVRIMSGIDSNRNGVLDGIEVVRTSYLCNGEAGANGQNGTNGQNGLPMLLSSSQLGAGAQCPAGGYRINSGLDTNRNGQLDITEITSSFYVCNGADGQDGQNGADGQDGQNGTNGQNGLTSLVLVTDIFSGAVCPTGGKQIQTGLDVNNDGVLQSSEVQQTSMLCNGEQGAPGQPGNDGSDGQNGATGAAGMAALISTEVELPGANCVAGGVAVHTGLDSNGNGVLDIIERQNTSYVCNGIGAPGLDAFTLKYNATLGGSILGQNAQVVLLGGDGAAVTAIANEGYYFTGWSDGLGAATRADLNVQSDLTLTAGFAQYVYTLSYSASNNGSVVGIVGQTLFYGSDGTPVEALPNAGYHFVQWSDGSTLNPRVDLAVKNDLAVTASFAQNSYTLTYQAGAGGSITGNANQQVAHGASSTTVLAVPNSGYHFVQWSDGITTANRTDNNVQASLAVTAQFKDDLSPPENIQSGANNGVLELSWDDVPNADSYNIYYAQVPGVTPSNYSDLLGGGMVSNATNPTSLPQLTAGQRYYFVITTVINGVESALGDEITLLSPQTPWLVRPHQGRLQVELTSFNTATVRWQQVFGDGSYNLYISKDPTTDLSNYANTGTQLMLNVTSPVDISGLNLNEPVYLALETNGQISDWTNTQPRTWGVTGTVNTQVVDSDGTRYIGGEFDAVGMNVGGIVAFPANPDITNPHLLAMPTVDGIIEAVTSDGAGGWYIGGDFTHVGEQSRLRLAHIDATGQVTAWNPGANNTVRALLVHEGVVYAGGSFTAAGNSTASIARNHLASFNADGSLTTWNPNSNYVVYALAKSDTNLYVGGDFSIIGGGVRSGLAEFTLQTGMLTGRNMLATSTRSLAVDVNNGYVYAGGTGDDYYSSSGFVVRDSGSYRRYIKRFDQGGTEQEGRFILIATCSSNRSTDPCYSSNKFIDNITKLAITDGYLWVAETGQGDYIFDAGRGMYRVPTSSTTASKLSSSAYPSTASLISTNSKIYLGTTRSCQSVSQSGCEFIVIVFDATTGEVLFRPLTMDTHNQNTGLSVVLATDGETVFGGGSFDIAGKKQRRNVAAFDQSGFITDWNLGTDGPVNTLVKEDNTIYVGGSFLKVIDGNGYTDRKCLAAFDTQGNLLSWNPEIQGWDGQSIYSLALGDDAIYVGGKFRKVKGDLPRYNLAAFDYFGDVLPWNPSTNGVVNTLQYSNNILYAGGEFTLAGGGNGGYGAASRNYLAAFDTSGNVTDWQGTTDGPVTATAMNGSTLYVAGNFSSAGGSTGSASRKGAAAFSTSGNLLTTWNPGIDGMVNSLLFANNQIYAAGSFTAAGAGTANTPRNGLAAFTTTGMLTFWAPKTNGSHKSIVVDGNMVYIGGSFSTASDNALTTYQSNMAVFDTDGTLLDK